LALRIATLNCNGIRSAANKGLLPWAQTLAADCIGVQEVKAQAADIAGHLDQLAGLKGYFHFAEKKGYSGVGLYTARKPSAVRIGFGNPEFDAEGRYIELCFDNARRRFSLISCYFPSGTTGELRQAAKYRFLDALWLHLIALKAEREFVLVGDINIAHKEIDLRNWRSNQKNSGFLPEERAWMTRLFDEAGLVDVFRTLNPDPDQYTWWSNRGQAWANNVGWRLDYHIATPAIAAKAKRCEIFLGQRFSDHAPLLIDYDFKL
jgi:exodeoxyribonuclease III